jgi:hypothetical protein
MNNVTSCPHFSGLRGIDDLVNGLAITLTSGDKSFDFSEAYLTLSDITQILYQSVDTEPSGIRARTRPPTDKDINFSLLGKRLVIAYSIAPNKNQENVHIHGYVYGLSNYAKDIKTWISYMETELKRLKPFSSKNRYSIVMKPVYDPIDVEIRDSGSYEYLVSYLTSPHYDTFLHYLAYRNNKQLLYSYTQDL